MEKREFKRYGETKSLLKKIADKYGIKKLSDVVDNNRSLLYEKDVFICLHNIVDASLAPGDILENLRSAKNLYNSPIFAVNSQKGIFLIKNKSDFEKAILRMKDFSNCFHLNPYSIINTFLAIIETQITGFDLEKLYEKGKKHVGDFIKYSLKNNSNWDKKTLISKSPVLIIPIGAAGGGKSTFYRELSNVINISCDNVRYLLLALLLFVWVIYDVFSSGNMHVSTLSFKYS